MSVTSVGSTGPVQLMIIGFLPGAELRSRVFDELNRLQGRGLLRLLDLLVVTRHDDGSLTRVDIGEGDFGDLMVSVTDLDPQRLFALVEDRGDAILNEVQGLAHGSTIAFLLIEHRWATPLFEAMAVESGVLLGDGFITETAQALVNGQVSAFDEAARSIAAARGAELEAAQESAAAVLAAEETVEAAHAVGATAAQGAVNALIDAGFVEYAAAEEAMDAIAAGARDVDVAQHEVAETKVAASVSAREIRVLRYLPTSMTFAVIADKLGISRSAAKERAERAYQKMGVHNRADAVTRARELHLINQS